MATDWAGLIGNGLSAWSAWNQNQTAGDLADAAKGYSSNLMNNQNFYNDQLKNLVTDPSKFLDNPLYKAAFDQGTEAVTRGAASSGFLGSGNMAASLQQYGQSFASNYLLQQEQLLGSLAGLNGNPISGINTAANINATSGNFLGSLVGELGKYYGKDITKWANSLFGSGSELVDGTSSLTGMSYDAAGMGAATSDTAAPVISDLSNVSTPSLDVAAGSGSSALAGEAAAGSLSSIAGPSLGAAYGAGGVAGTAAGVAGTEGASSVAGPTLESMFGTTAGEAGLSGGSAVSGGSSGAAGGAGIGSYLGAIGTAVAIGSGILGDVTGSHNVGVSNPKPGQVSTSIPWSGMPAVQMGNMVIGLGNDSSKGSGYVYRQNADGSLEKIGSTADGDIMTNYTRAVMNGPNGVTNTQGSDPKHYTSVSKVMSRLTQEMKDLYSRTGGADAWGMPVAAWMNQVVQLRSSISGEPSGGW